jgi:uncharacterized protein (TIGR03437 family)
MTIFSSIRTARPILVIAAFAATASPAQTFNVLVNCDTTNASSYAPLTRGTDGNFYGTTTQGKTYGTIFRMTPAGSVTTLHVFNNTDGSTPYGGLVLGSDGNFYGTTWQGGTSRDGTVFQITPGGTLTSLYSFSGSTDGMHPYGKLVQASDGNFYGTTSQGGSSGLGTVFTITSGGILTTLHTFTSRPDGGTPRDGLIQASDGYFYGTTSGGGANGLGVVFRISTAGDFSVLHSFASTEGTSPYAALLEGSDGNFYGTTWQGGTKSDGTIFRITPTGKLTTLYNFTGADGKNPSGALIQGSDGNLYGTTYQGGDAIYGVVFAITTGGAFTRLHSFTGSDGQYPTAALLQADNGLFYGTAYQGGATNKGVIFSVSYTAPPAPAPVINSGGVVPVYSSSPTIQPGEWVSIYGSNLAGQSTTWNGDFPVSLGGTSVTINGKAAYVWYVSTSQLNVQAPDDTQTGIVPVVVTTASGSATSTVTLDRFAPSLSLLDNKHVAGIILRSDGSGAYGNGGYDIIGPTGTSLGYSTVAAKAGDSIVLFGVGFGPTTPAIAAGQAYSGAAPTTYGVTVSINNTSVLPEFSGLSAAGLYQLNLTVPSGPGTGDVPLQATVNGVRTPSGAVISLQ